MPLDLTLLDAAPRLLLDVPLRPVQGSRFQPTGFPDLGAATYQAGGRDCLLVESAQSMANRLEATIWDAGENTFVAEAKGLSHVRVNGADGAFLTDSVLEAHRLNSVYIEHADGGAFHSQLAKEIGFDEKKPIDRARFLKTLLIHDVNALLHGVFLESIGGRLRIPRAMSAFIEANEIGVAASGGVKNDHCMPGKDAERGAAEGFGNVPFHREEYTGHITAYFNVDLAQIRSYGLGKEATRMLVILALYKIRSLLDGDLRLRTACDLMPDEKRQAGVKPAGFVVPALADLKIALQEAVTACPGMSVTTLTYAGEGGKSKSADKAKDGKEPKGGGKRA